MAIVVSDKTKKVWSDTYIMYSEKEENYKRMKSMDEIDFSVGFWF